PYYDVRHRPLHSFPTRRSSDLTSVDARSTPVWLAQAGAPAPHGFDPQDKALKYDLVIANGEVLDPSQKLRGKRDLGIKHGQIAADRKSTRLNSSHDQISYAVFC